MRIEQFLPESGRIFEQRSDFNAHLAPNVSRHLVIGLLLVVALLAFEIFNFDTTRYALSDLLGDASFSGVPWAAILALAFCAIDFAGLAHLFTPAEEDSGPRESWYLMGAWLLGATMNAVMTWWAVNLTLLDHSLGNEILSREQILNVVPPFVAVLVWVTRILFIGAFSVAGNQLFRLVQQGEDDSSRDQYGRDEVYGEARQPQLTATRAMPTARPVRAMHSAPTRENRANRPERLSRERPVRRQSQRDSSNQRGNSQRPFPNATPPMPTRMSARPYRRQ
jgi:hypothetical protein